MTIWKKLFILVPLVMVSPGPVSAQDKAADLAIVVNNSCSLENVTRAELVKIFRAERGRTPEGVKFVIVMRETGSPERNAALGLIYNMTDREFEKFFLQATFAGTVQTAPRQLSGSAAMRQFVAGAPGAIGYIRADEAGASVKVLKIDGKSPGDADYPLKLK